MRLEARSVALASAAIACSSAAVVAVACIIAPPPETPQTSPEPPRIVSVSPPTSPPLLAWPEGGFFIVGVNPENPDDPTARPSFNVFLDGQGTPSIVNLPPAMVPDDAGVSTISFPVSALNLGPDDNVCPHTVTLVVAVSFNSSYVPNPPGAASVTWTYAGPNAPYGCIGSTLDGQPPPTDAADGPFTPPSDGGGLDP